MDFSDLSCRHFWLGKARLAERDRGAVNDSLTLHGDLTDWCWRPSCSAGRSRFNSPCHVCNEKQEDKSPCDFHAVPVGFSQGSRAVTCPSFIFEPRMTVWGNWNIVVDFQHVLFIVADLILTFCFVISRCCTTQRRRTLLAEYNPTLIHLYRVESQLDVVWSLLVYLRVDTLLQGGEHALDAEDFYILFSLQECHSWVSPQYSSNLLPRQPPKRMSLPPLGKGFFTHFPCSDCWYFVNKIGWL